MVFDGCVRIAGQIEVGMPGEIERSGSIGCRGHDGLKDSGESSRSSIFTETLPR